MADSLPDTSSGPEVVPPARRPVSGTLAGMIGQTNIDRRTCTRVVPMKVLCLGLGRTGTSSLRQALLDLGYSDVYHFASLLQENPRDSEMWIDAFQAKFHGKGKLFEREEFDQLLGHCMAVTDLPCALFAKELLEAYPDAKVILTVRDSPQQWVASSMNTLIKYTLSYITPPPASVLGALYNCFRPALRPVDRFMVDMVTSTEPFMTLIADARSGSTQASEAIYLAHNERIRTMVPAENLLIMNVRDGWDPLCTFLGHKPPAWAFPRVNSTSEFLENTAEVNLMMTRIINARIVRTIVAVTAVSAVGIAWWARYSRGFGSSLW